MPTMFGWSRAASRRGSWSSSSKSPALAVRDLDGDLLVDPGVLGEEDGAEAAGAQVGEDLVLPDGLRRAGTWSARSIAGRFGGVTARDRPSATARSPPPRSRPSRRAGCAGPSDAATNPGRRAAASTSCGLEATGGSDEQQQRDARRARARRAARCAGVSRSSEARCRRTGARQAAQRRWWARRAARDARPHCSAAPHATCSQRSGARALERRACGRVGAHVTTGQTAATPSSVAFWRTSSMRSPLSGEPSPAPRVAATPARATTACSDARGHARGGETSSSTASYSCAGSVEHVHLGPRAQAQHLARVVRRVLGQLDARTGRGARHVEAVQAHGRAPQLRRRARPTRRAVRLRGVPRRGEGLAHRRRRRPSSRPERTSAPPGAHEVLRSSPRGRRAAGRGQVGEHECRRLRAESRRPPSPRTTCSRLAVELGVVRARRPSPRGRCRSATTDAAPRRARGHRQQRRCPRRGRARARAGAGGEALAARPGRAASSRGCRCRRRGRGRRSAVSAAGRGRRPSAGRSEAARAKGRKPSRKRATQSTSGTGTASSRAPGSARASASSVGIVAEVGHELHAALALGLHLDALGAGVPEERPWRRLHGPRRASRAAPCMRRAASRLSAEDVLHPVEKRLVLLA